MGSASGKSNFTFYNDVKIHKCEEIRGKKKERIYFYQCGPCLTLDLNLVTYSDEYKKKVCCIQPSCDCSKKKVTLEIRNQMAISQRYKPNKTYEYKTRQDVNTANGFNYWLREITRSIWEEDKDFDIFISGLMPGKLFYDGYFIQKIAKLMQQKVDFNRMLVKNEPTFMEMLKNFIKYAAELKENSVVVNEINA